MPRIKKQVSPRVDYNSPNLDEKGSMNSRSANCWLSSLTEDFFSSCGMLNINIYYYLDPKTGQIDTDCTLRAMFAQLRFGWCKDLTETLSAYFSIINIFTYPEFRILAPKLPSHLGITLQPTSLSAWEMESVPDFDTPLSSDDKIAALAIGVLLLEYTNRESIIDFAREVCKVVGVFNSDLLDVNKLNDENCKQTGSFLSSAFYIQFSKYIYDCLLQKAVAAGNKKIEKVLELCAEKMPTIMACEINLIMPELV